MDAQMQLLLEKIQEKLEKQTISISESVTHNIMQQIGEKFQKLDEQNQQLRAEVSELKEKIKILETQKKRKNLLFFGIKEVSEYESNTIQFMKDKINTHLSINIQEHEINKAHRVGSKKSNGCRPILVSFISNWRRNFILKNKNKFPQGVYIKEDFTKEMLEIRKSLQPKINEERNKGNIAYIRGDKIIVKKPTESSREKRKREPSSSPNLESGAQNQQKCTMGTKKLLQKNAFELMSRPRCGSLTQTPPESPKN